MFTCSDCAYSTSRKDNYKRHMHCPKHIKVLSSKAKVNSNTEEKVIEEPQQLSCFKCKEIYNSKRRLHDHQKTCSGIDSLTCPRCMKTFDHRSNKSRHIKKGNCKPVSVFEYLKRKGMIENSNSNETNIHGDNNTVNNTNNMTTNIYINNYGKERIDYISFDDLLNILKCYNHSIPNYIKYKHFNPLFPENHNIKYKDNIFFIKKNNEWNIINSGALSNKLYTE
jgi:hypothetical protein